MPRELEAHKQRDAVSKLKTAYIEVIGEEAEEVVGSYMNKPTTFLMVMKRSIPKVDESKRRLEHTLMRQSMDQYVDARFQVIDTVMQHTVGRGIDDTIGDHSYIVEPETGTALKDDVAGVLTMPFIAGHQDSMLSIVCHDAYESGPNGATKAKHPIGKDAGHTVSVPAIFVYPDIEKWQFDDSVSRFYPAETYSKNGEAYWHRAGSDATARQILSGLCTVDMSQTDIALS